MTDGAEIFSVERFVNVTYDAQLRAVYLKYFSLFDDTGTIIPKAVRAAAAFASRNNVQNWIADTSAPTDNLSETDAEWVGTDEFRNILLQSPVEKFLLVPPRPETGQDTDWIPGWQADTQAGFGAKIKVMVLSEPKEIWAFLVGNV